LLSLGQTITIYITLFNSILLPALKIACFIILISSSVLSRIFYFSCYYSGLSVHIKRFQLNQFSNRGTLTPGHICGFFGAICTCQMSHKSRLPVRPSRVKCSRNDIVVTTALYKHKSAIISINLKAVASFKCSSVN